MTGNDAASPSKCNTVDIHVYVAQLEQRVQEQASLIQLLKEKVAGLEESSAATQTHSSGTMSTYAKVARTSATRPDAVVITGSRLSEISAVQITRQANFFVTRINPSVSAAELTLDLLTYASELRSAVCSKMKTKHASYSSFSFYFTVPEDQKHVISSDAAWPQGVLVKPFAGKLLKDYVLEKYDSLDPEGSSVPKESKSTVSSASTHGSSKSANDKADKTKRNPASLSGKSGSVIPPGRGSKTTPTANSANTSSKPTPTANIGSPKNGVLTRAQKTG